MIKNEFQEFLAAAAPVVPEELSRSVVSRIQQELRPSGLRVFTKLAFFQFIIGGLTLLFCPQFGITITSSRGLMPYLMQFGEGACMLGCGALFTGASILVASFALKAEEIRALRRHKFLHLISVAGLSLGALLCLGGEVVLALGLVWLAGAVAAALLSLEASWKLRQLFARRALV